MVRMRFLAREKGLVLVILCILLMKMTSCQFGSWKQVLTFSEFMLT